MTYQILMIEDDEQICEVVKDYFTRESENEIVVRDRTGWIYLRRNGWILYC